MTIKLNHRPVAVNPLRFGQTLGGAVALQGFYRAIPIVHGGQGCAAFIRTLMTGHYREPIALQTSALMEMNVILGAEANLRESLDTVIAKNNPDLIAVMSTSLTEMAGGDDLRTDIKRYVRDRNIQDTLIVAASTSDFSGSLESGYAIVVEAVLDGILERVKRGEKART